MFMRHRVLRLILADQVRSSTSYPVKNFNIFNDTFTQSHSYFKIQKRDNDRPLVWAAGVGILTATTVVLGLVALAGYFVLRD